MSYLMCHAQALWAKLKMNDSKKLPRANVGAAGFIHAYPSKHLHPMPFNPLLPKLFVQTRRCKSIPCNVRTTGPKNPPTRGEHYKNRKV